MTVQGSSCPTMEQLSFFRLGKLDSRSAEFVHAHLVACNACRQAIARLMPEADRAAPPTTSPAAPHAQAPTLAAGPIAAAPYAPMTPVAPRMAQPAPQVPQAPTHAQAYYPYPSAGMYPPAGMYRPANPAAVRMPYPAGYAMPAAYPSQPNPAYEQTSVAERIEPPSVLPVLALCMTLFAGLIVGLMMAWNYFGYGELVLQPNVPLPTVIIDGHVQDLQWEEGGYRARLKIRTGPHLVEFQKNGFTSSQKEIVVQGGGRIKLSLSLNKSLRGAR